MRMRTVALLGLAAAGVGWLRARGRSAGPALAPVTAERDEAGSAEPTSALDPAAGLPDGWSVVEAGRPAGGDGPSAGADGAQDD